MVILKECHKLMNRHIYTYDLIYKAEQESFKEIDSFEIMKKAAKSCANYINKNYKHKRIIIYCGPGNNGGDGILISKYLLEKNFFVEINFPISLPKTKDSKKALILLDNNNKIVKKPNLKNNDLIIDAIFGIGLTREPDNNTIKLFSLINKSNIEVVSIDMPSGISVDNGQIKKNAIIAKTTLTFHRYKIGHWLLPGKDYCGNVKLLNIGLNNLDYQSKFQLNYPEKIPTLPSNIHKFGRGSCFIIADNNLIGAAKLSFLSASQSALRAGAGLCKLLIHHSHLMLFKPHILEEMVITYKSYQELTTIINKQKPKVIIFGCGMDANSNNGKILEHIIKKKINLVLDASVFSIIKKRKKHYMSLLKKRKYPVIMTPHEGEFKRIYKITGDKIKDSIKAAMASNSYIVYKGNDTVICSPTGEIIINPYSTPHLATAGSGDVLTGLIGGLLSQEFDPIFSIKIACYVHSECGIKLGKGLIASDLIKCIPKILKFLEYK